MGKVCQMCRSNQQLYAGPHSVLMVRKAEPWEIDPDSSHTPPRSLELAGRPPGLILSHDTSVRLTPPQCPLF